MPRRFHSLAMRLGPRLLFAASIAMVLAGFLNFVSLMNAPFYYFATTEYIFWASMGPAAWLFFFAVLGDRLGRD
jgi:hypothetical protein